MKQIVITVLVVVGIIAGAMIISGGEDDAVGAASNNFYGQESGVITVTEYGDFECPACAGFYPIVDQVKESFADQVRFEFKHFPLVQIHPNATAAHRAAEAAAKQGMFWEMHDLLFERQASWRSSGQVGHSGAPVSNNNPTAIFEEYARELGLNIDQYKTDAAASETLATINTDIAEGRERGADSTPTFFIDGEFVEDLTTIDSVEDFSAVIQAKLDEKNGTNTTESAPAETSTAPEETSTEPETVQ